MHPLSWRVAAETNHAQFVREAGKFFKLVGEANWHEWKYDCVGKLLNTLRGHWTTDIIDHIQTLMLCGNLNSHGHHYSYLFSLVFSKTDAFYKCNEKKIIKENFPPSPKHLQFTQSETRPPTLNKCCCEIVVPNFSFTWLLKWRRACVLSTEISVDAGLTETSSLFIDNFLLV